MMKPKDFLNNTWAIILHPGIVRDIVLRDFAKAQGNWVIELGGGSHGPLRLFEEVKLMAQLPKGRKVGSPREVV